MTNGAFAGQSTGAANRGVDTRYQRASEHLQDRLARLDLLLRRTLAGRGQRTSTDYLSFAAITDDEVMRLLGAPGPEETPPANAAEGLEIAGALEELDGRIAQRIARTLSEGYRLPLVELAEHFRLSPLEQELLVLCAAAEVDRRYERIFGYLHDDLGRKLPSLGLALSILVPNGEASLTTRTVLGPSAPLRRWRLIEVREDDAPTPWLAKAMRLDERILAFLLGDSGPDARIADALSLGGSPATAFPHTRRRDADRARLRQLVAGWSDLGHEGRKPLVYVFGGPGCGAEDLVSEVAADLGLPVLSADLEVLARTGLDLSEALLLMFREALLCQAAILLREVESALDADPGGMARRALERWAMELGGLVFVTGRGPWRWPQPRPPLVLRTLGLRPEGLVEQLETWRGLIDNTTTAPCPIDGRALERLVSRHPLPASGIADAWRSAADLASLRGADAPVQIDDLEQACRTGVALPVSGLTRRIEPRHGWQDLVVPATSLEQLRSVCSQATHLATVYGAWGFERKLSLGKGLTSLFSGPPGTGKTMAAEVIAAELDLPLLKIDLSQVVSKYIGETEKNLRTLFDQAAAAHAILFFDEADALLGKRSAVGDAHDRYANTEVAYLLQKMEEFEGITILATNLRQNMDEAFTRRMRFLVDFPFPEEADRLRIWQGVWPPEVPRDDDVDLPRLARHFRLSGGNIRNIALAATFLAAEDDHPVTMGHLLQATRRELQKMGRLLSETEERFRV